MNSGKSKIVIPVIIFGILFGFVFVVLLLLLSYFLFLRGDSVEEKEVHHYQILEVDPSLNESSSGIASILEEIPPGEFHTYHDDGVYILISHFGADEFECHGKCYCDLDIDSNRKYAAVGATRGIFTLVAAVSTAFAIQFAQKQFSDDCQNILQDVCSLGNVRSEVDSCDKPKGAILESMPKAKEKSGEDVMLPDDEVYAQYYCKGSCQWNYKKYDQFDPDVDNECSNYFLDKDIVLKSRIESSPVEERAKVRKLFAHRHLIPFCKEREPRCYGRIIGCRQTGVTRKNLGDSVTY